VALLLAAAMDEKSLVRPGLMTLPPESKTGTDPEEHVQVYFAGDEEIEGKKWYMFHVIDRWGNFKICKKRYSHFKQLHADICERGRLRVVDLPPAGFVGLRHRLNLGHFNTERQLGLEHYVNSLLDQIDFINTHDQDIAAFFGLLPDGSFTSKPSKTQKERVEFVNTEDIDGVTWYCIKVVDQCEQRLFKKRYNDFKRLDQNLRKHGALDVPDLPEPGMFGLRNRLRVQNFSRRRRHELERYLMCLLSQVDSIAADPDLDEFIGLIGNAHEMWRLI